MLSAFDKNLSEWKKLRGANTETKQQQQKHEKERNEGKKTTTTKMK